MPTLFNCSVISIIIQYMICKYLNHYKTSISDILMKWSYFNRIMTCKTCQQIKFFYNIISFVRLHTIYIRIEITWKNQSHTTVRFSGCCFETEINTIIKSLRMSYSLHIHLPPNTELANVYGENIPNEPIENYMCRGWVDI